MRERGYAAGSFEPAPSDSLQLFRQSCGQAQRARGAVSGFVERQFDIGCELARRGSASTAITSPPHARCGWIEQQRYATARAAREGLFKNSSQDIWHVRHGRRVSSSSSATTPTHQHLRHIVAPRRGAPGLWPGANRSAHIPTARQALNARCLLPFIGVQGHHEGRLVRRHLRPLRAADHPACCRAWRPACRDARRSYLRAAPGERPRNGQSARQRREGHETQRQARRGHRRRPRRPGAAPQARRSSAARGRKPRRARLSTKSGYRQNVNVGL